MRPATRPAPSGAGPRTRPAPDGPAPSHDATSPAAPHQPTGPGPTTPPALDGPGPAPSGPGGTPQPHPQPATAAGTTAEPTAAESGPDTAGNQAGPGRTARAGLQTPQAAGCRPVARAGTRLSYAGRDYQLDPGESVLDGLARHGVHLPSACRAGACHGCLLKADAGDPGAPGQRGLRPALAANGYFLACITRPVTDLAVRSGQDVITPGRLAASRWLSPSVLAVWIRPHRPVGYRAGQHVTLDRGNGVIRAYSIANLPAEAARDGLEFHVRIYPDGAMSAWLAGAPPGSPLGIGVPAGECYYTPGAPAASLLLAGTGTGISPLLAIAHDAQGHGHTGPVILLQGAAKPAGLYWATWAPRRPVGHGYSIQRRTCTLSRGQDIVTAVTGELAALGGPAATRAFLCGGPRAVAAMRRALFLAGMSLRDICADQFLPGSGAPP